MWKTDLNNLKITQNFQIQIRGIIVQNDFNLDLNIGGHVRICNNNLLLFEQYSLKCNNSVIFEFDFRDVFLLN